MLIYSNVGREFLQVSYCLLGSRYYRSAKNAIMVALPPRLIDGSFPVRRVGYRH